MNVYDFIKIHEGLRLKPYLCTAGKTTIGWGRNLDDNGISEEEASTMLANDVEMCVRELQRNYSGYAILDEVRQAVLIDMVFNLGWPRLSQFKKMFAALDAQDYIHASREMLNSRWADQVGMRAKRLADMMRTGDWYV